MSQIARVRCSITGLEGGTGLLTAYFAGPGDIDGTIALEGAKRVRASMASLAGMWLPAVVYQVQPVVDVLTAETGALANSFGVTAQSPVPGTGTGDTLPGSIQGLLQLNTGAVSGGRRVRGRINIAGITEGFNGAAGLPSSGATANLAAAGTILNTLILTACSNVVWHRPKGGAGGSAFLVTSYSGSSKWATLRSRRD